MNVKIVYPAVDKKRIRSYEFRSWVRWLFFLIAYACPIINIASGGHAWSIVVIWSLRFIWSFTFSPDLVEYNRISQTAKLIAYSCILLILIDTFLSPGWAMFVVPIFCTVGLILIGTLFFSDLTKQRQNIMPMLWLVFASIIAILSSLAGWPDRNWPMTALGATAFGILLLCVVVLGKSLLLEMEKRFHTR